MATTKTNTVMIIIVAVVLASLTHHGIFLFIQGPWRLFRWDYYGTYWCWWKWIHGQIQIGGDEWWDFLLVVIWWVCKYISMVHMVMVSM
jgi:hypothetical protein